MTHYANLLTNTKDENLVKEKAQMLKGMAMNPATSKWGRYAAANSVKRLRDDAYIKVDKDY